MTKLLACIFMAWLIYTLVIRPRQDRRLVTDEAEARAILGVSAQAGADEIREAHRRLVSAVHPDRGGSADLTRRINAARDVLLHRKN